MRSFVDTSALYAVLDEDDRNHGPAVGWFTGPAREPEELLMTHNYVVVETAALVRSRLGTKASRVLVDAFLPALSVMYVDKQLHLSAMAIYRAAPGGPSLVDRVSFEWMREQRIDRAFAFDRDFAAEGFQTVP